MNEAIYQSGQPASVRSSASDNMRILVVDDESSIRWGLSQNLAIANQSFQVGTATCAEDALAIVSSTGVDVLITDLRLPNMDGLHLMKAVQGLSPNTRSILMTAYGTEDVQRKAISVGCTGYLEKPFSVEKLIELISPREVQEERSAQNPDSMTLLDILQLYSASEVSTVFYLQSRDIPGEVVMTKGTISHAAYNGTTGLDAFVALLTCHNPMISVTPTGTKLKLDLQNIETLTVNSNDLKELRNEFAPQQIRENLAPKQSKRAKKRKAKKKDPNDTQSFWKKNAKDRSNVERAKRECELEDFGEDDLVLAPEPEERSANVTDLHDINERILILGPDLAVEKKNQRSVTDTQRRSLIREALDTGIMHFRRHDFEEAKRCWDMALELDPDCEQAKKNLQVLKSILSTDKTNN